MKCPHCKEDLTKIKIEFLPEIIGDNISVSLDNTRAVICPKCDEIISVICSSAIEK